MGVVFFDFTDAFGNVNRIRLLERIRSAYGIKGKLFNHIADFLKSRKARIKVNDIVGEWLDSTTGTSAGTVLGPVLFTVSADDIPKGINPKFADDTAALAIGDTAEEVEGKLQELVNALSDWCKLSGMQMNVKKTKVMNFSETDENFTIKVEGEVVEQVSSHKYLGIILDEKLQFNLQVENAIGKAKSALNKVCTLIRGRKGISLGIGIELYKSLIRPHLEYAIPAWAMLSEKLIQDLERVQNQSLKRILGVFQSTSSIAVEVISGITPFRLRIQELCMKEWIKIQTLKENHSLRLLLQSEVKFFNGKEGSPLGYIEYLSKELKKGMGNEKLKVPVVTKLTPEVMRNQETVQELKIFKSNLGSSKSRTKEQEEVAKREFGQFLNAVNSDSYLVYSDGSVAGEAYFGDGGCGVVLTKKGNPALEVREARKVGRKVDNVRCEVEGVVVALELLVQICSVDVGSGTSYILTDCQSAVDIVVYQKDYHKKGGSFDRIWAYLRVLRSLGVDVKIAWIPGHANLQYNEIADQLAKEGSRFLSEESEPEIVSDSVLKMLIKDITNSNWSRMWRRAESGDWTRDIVGLEVGRRHVLPKDRSCGMTYVRSLVNNAAVKDNLFRMGFSEGVECECSNGRDTVAHVLMDCVLEAESREEYIESVGKLWMESRCSGNLNVDLQLMLCPSQKEGVTGELGMQMLMESFKFFKKLTRKL